MSNKPQTYFCNKCSTERPVSEFAVDRSRKRGHASTCRHCKSEYLKKRYDKIKYDTYRRYCSLVSVARKKDYEFNISLTQYEKLVKNNECYYCDNDLNLEKGYSLDRIDNSRGYTNDNVLPCCSRCNLTRQDKFTVEEWKVAMQAIKAMG